MIATGFVLAFALVPFASPHCPGWTVTVVDKEDHPIPGMTVRLSYQNYSLEDQQHEMDRIADQRGQVKFPAQTIYASFLRRCYYTLLSAGAGVHASFGPSASVFAFGKGMEGSDATLSAAFSCFGGAPQANCSPESSSIAPAGATL